MNTASTNAAQQGRQDLANWLEAQPSNFYREDPLLPQLLARVGGEAFVEEMDERLERFGAICAGPLDQAVAINNRGHNLPRLERYDGIGRRLEAVEHHPSYREAGAFIYGAGQMSAYSERGAFLKSLSLFALSSMCGEAGHNCPLACTAGVIKTLQALGSDADKERWLPGLLNANYGEHLEGAQFLTEIQGGSDVGRNAIVARHIDGDRYAIEGEKWFCSNAHADLILMTARFDADTEGTRGLGLFLIPRRLETGELNAYAIRRLKDKLGTRSMPSGEIDFHGAEAICMGPVDEGFRHMMELVINTSRIYNAVAVAGAARRAWQVARGYAQHREAFGGPIAQFPLVQRTIADMRAWSSAILAGTFELIELADRRELGQLNKEELLALRTAVNLNKSFSARLAVENTWMGIEILGGNGAIESFSVMPRLHRDMLVCENWEGTHNTLTAQVLRDFARYEMHLPFLASVMKGLDIELADSKQRELRDSLLREVDSCRSVLDAMDFRSPCATLQIRSLVDQMCAIHYGAALLRQAQHQLQQSGAREMTDVCEYFIARRVGRREERFDSEFLMLTQRVSR